MELFWRKFLEMIQNTLFFWSQKKNRLLDICYEI